MKSLIEIAPNILAAESRSIDVSQTAIEDLKRRASASLLQRARILAHGRPEASLHEMLIVQTNSVYVRPHRHHAKSESLHVVEGFAKVIFFDDDGKIEECMEVGPASSGKSFFLRTNTARWHTQVIISPYFVFHEVTNGPLVQKDSEFAPWAPDGSNSEELANFQAELAEQIRQWPK